MKRERSPWGMRCKTQMLLMGKTLRQLSAETNYSVSYLSAIINGRIIVPDATIKAISEALEVDMALER